MSKHRGAKVALMDIDHISMGQTFSRPAAPAEAMLVLVEIEQHDAMIAVIASGEGAPFIDLTLQPWDLNHDRMDRYVRPNPLRVDIFSFEDQHNAI